MTHPESRHKALAHTLGMAVEDITASIGALIARFAGS
jgi:hypothetical protein